uniref:Uncharacterized protein n=1 Tax=Tetranychus urticae TaxID=32264 RepID=T1K3F7_TETUR
MTSRRRSFSNNLRVTCRISAQRREESLEVEGLLVRQGLPSVLYPTIWSTLKAKVTINNTISTLTVNKFVILNVSINLFFWFNTFLTTFYFISFQVDSQKEDNGHECKDGQLGYQKPQQDNITRCH